MHLNIDPVAAAAAYFGSVLACSHTELDTPDAVIDAVEATATSAYTDAHAEYLGRLNHPVTVIEAAEARGHAYETARTAARDTYAALTGRTPAPA